MNYIIKITTGSVDSEGNNYNAFDQDKRFAGTNIEEAKEAMKKIASEQNVELGEYAEVSLWSANLQDGYDEECDEIIDYLEEADCEDYIMVEPEYRKLEDAVVLYWSWHRYTGYAREFKSVEVFWGKGNEQMCIPIDSAVSTQTTVIAWPEELQGLTEDDKVALVSDRISEMGKWDISFEAIEAKVKNIF